MATSLPSSVSLYLPTTGDGELVFLRDGSRCWALLFSTRGAARGYRRAAGLTDMSNQVLQLEALARKAKPDVFGTTISIRAR